MRDALSLLDQCSASEKIDIDAVYSAMGLAGNRRTTALLNHIIEHDVQATLEIFNSMWMDGKDPVSLLNELSSLMRDVLMLHVAPKGGLELISGGYELSALKSFASKLTKEELICAMNTVQEYVVRMRDMKSPKTAVELCLVSLCDNTAGESVQSLRARISRLEEKLENGIPVTAFSAVEEYEPFEYEEPPHREEYGLAEEDDIDPLQFVEEQPEDMLSKRVEAPKIEELSDAQVWKKICDKLRGQLPPFVSPYVDNTNEVRAHVDGSVLKIEVIPGFRYTSFSNADVTVKFAQAASEVLGREMRVQVSELSAGQREKRDLLELEKFPEVNFKN